MNKFNAFIEKRNFKKIFIVYIIAAIICGIACAGAIGYVFKDKINLALQYEKANEVLKKGNSDSKKKQSIDTLANSSDDICDILLLDEKNNILYSAKNSSLGKDNAFVIEREEGSRFLQSRGNPDTVFRFVKKEEFMLSAVFADDFTEIHNEYDEDGFYLDNFQNKKLYMISLLGKKVGGAKAYVISNPQPAANGMLVLKISAGIAMLFFMLYMILVALWVYQNALISKLFAPAWGILVLFTNLAGVFVYLIYKHINVICGFCGAVQSKGNIFCTECGKKIGIVCTHCGHFLKPTDNYCPKCGHKRD